MAPQMNKLSPMGILTVAALLYVFYTEPSEKALVLAVIAVAGWIYFKSCSFPLAAVGVFYAVKLYNMANAGPAAPVLPALPASAYPPKDALSISQRVQDIKGAAPLAPKVASPTGVLESPTILDAAPLQPLDQLATEALPGATIPAGVKARVIINPPAEQTVPRDNNPNRALMENPYLQNGPDGEGLDTALIATGTDVPPAVGGDAMAGVASGAGNAF